MFEMVSLPQFVTYLVVNIFRNHQQKKHLNGINRRRSLNKGSKYIMIVQ